MGTILKWALTVAFAGVIIGIIIQFNTLSADQRKKYKWWLIAAVILTGIGTLVQLFFAG